MPKNKTINDLPMEVIDEAAKIYREADSMQEAAKKSWDYIYMKLEELNNENDK